MRRRLPSVTIRAVAERAGVSAMTVSNVVNGTGRVSAATTEVVRAAIADLGYVPNVAARRLGRARATTIGMMYNALRTPFLEELLVGALRTANARGLQLVLHEGDVASPDEAATAAWALVRSGADALLLIPPFAEQLSASGALAELGVPASAIATGHPLPDVSTVRIDNRTAMSEMTRYVITRGHRRIGFLAGAPTHSDSHQRRLGYDDALRSGGLAPDASLIVEGRFDYRSGVEAAARFLAMAVPPTAVICSNDDMAAGLVAAASIMGWRLPQDLAVTGFDDSLVAALMWPALTVIRQPAELMAVVAVEQLTLALTGRTSDRPQDRLLDYTLIERASVPLIAAGP